MSEDIRLFDHDEESGITEYMIFDNDTGDFKIQYQQDVEPIMELSKYMYNNAPLRWGELTHVKHIPAVIAMELCKQGIMSAGYKILDEKRFVKFLNERDTRHFCTRPGNI